MSRRATVAAVSCLLVSAIALVPSPTFAVPARSLGVVGATRHEPTQVPTSLPRHREAATRPTMGWIVATRPGSTARRLAARMGVTAAIAALGVYVLREREAAELVATLKAAGVFAYAEPDVAVRADALPTDPQTPLQWWTSPLIAPPLVPPTQPAPNTLAIIDGGVDQTNPEFTDAHITQVGPGSADVLHGTAVASVATAPANGVGIVGLWPGLPARLYESGGSCAGAAAAVMAAARDGARVINMSYGVDCHTHYLATQYATGLGSLLVASAGNTFPDPGPLPRPAGDPHVLTVAAVSQDLTVAPFSNASDWMDLAAPGVAIPAAVPLASDTADGAQDGVALLDGTSIAAPLVSAAAAWIRTARPTLTAIQTTEVLRSTAQDLATPGWDDRTGFGLMNLSAALTAPTPLDDPDEPNDDITWIDGHYLPRNPAALRHQASMAFGASLDYFEDPVDVTAVYVPHATRLRVDVTPGADSNIDLELFTRKATTTVYERRPKTLKARSHQPGSTRETVYLTNRGPTTLVYVAAFVPPTTGFADARYRISLRRMKLKKGASCGPINPTHGCLR